MVVRCRKKHKGKLKVRCPREKRMHCAHRAYVSAFGSVPVCGKCPKEQRGTPDTPYPQSTASPLSRMGHVMPPPYLYRLCVYRSLSVYLHSALPLTPAQRLWPTLGAGGQQPLLGP